MIKVRVKWLSRCGACNAPLEPGDEALITNHRRVSRYLCPACAGIYEAKGPISGGKCDV